MDVTTISDRPRKRRAINACVACRTSKVRCDGDGQQPCRRCERNGTSCHYYEITKDPTVLRIEKLETDVSILQAGISNSASRSPETAPFTIGSLPSTSMSEPGAPSNAAQKGLITWDQAASWFQSFFSGSHYLVPIFCERHDTFQSVLARSAFLFDAIVSIGCRAEEGFNSLMHRRLQSRLREHLTNLLINTATPSFESVQAIALMAAYSENGFTLIALALRFAMQLRLQSAVDNLVAKTAVAKGSATAEERELYRLARVWHGICNLELFFSLDGGKLPGIALRTSSRRIRSLINHPERTRVDVRLLSQVELNLIRTDAYNTIANQHSTSLFPENEALLRSTLDETTVELTLWHEEWTAIIKSSEPTPHQQTLALLNLGIQYEWALITLRLKALSNSGIENIAIMNSFQRDMVRTAKEAAARHLHHLLENSSPSSPSESPDSSSHISSPPAYLSTFKWAMDYVWAKCAFSVLLVLKLSLLLRDPVPEIIELLHDAHKVLEELKKIAVGHIAYFQILQTSIEKCEGALGEYLAQQPGAVGSEVLDETRSAAENDFQGYVPSEFVFEWDFPGLNLRHMPLGWQELFINLDSVF